MAPEQQSAQTSASPAAPTTQGTTPASSPSSQTAGATAPVSSPASSTTPSTTSAPSTSGAAAPGRPKPTFAAGSPRNDDPEDTPVDFEALSEETYEDGDIEGETAPAATPASSSEGQPPAQPAKPAPGTTQLPTAGEQPPASETAQQPQQPQQPQPQQPAAPAAAQKPEDIAAQRAQWRASTIKSLATTHFKLPEGLASALEAAPAEVIPQLMAKTYLDAVEAATYAVMANLPEYLGRFFSVQQQVDQGEQKFYSAWPALDRKTDHATITKIAAAYRSLNPSATEEDMIQNVGAMAMMSLKRQAAAAQQPQQPPSGPAARPFRPAGSGAPRGAGNGAGGQPQNPFSAMAEEFLQEDLGE